MKRLSVIRLLLFIVSCGFVALVGSAEAQINACVATVTPSSVAPGTVSDFKFVISNNDTEDDIQWVKILRPSGDFTVIEAGATGWLVTSAATEVTLEGNAISPGSVTEVMIKAQTAQKEAEAANWGVYVSDAPDGTGASSCQNNTAVEITSAKPFQISNIGVTAVSTTSVTISWNSSRPATSKIEYGQDHSYSNTITSSEGLLTTTHSIKLSNLKPQSLYQYRVFSSTETGQSAVSQNMSFVTGSLATSAPLSEVSKDSMVPLIAVQTDMSRPFTKIPDITVAVSDNSGIALIEYSTDGGRNWLPVNNKIPVGSKNAKFNFVPNLIVDGSYLLVMRTTDTAGNQATTEPKNLVIDMLPPQVGGSVISQATQVVMPAERNTYILVFGVEYKLSTSAIGGATNIKLVARARHGNSAQFDMKQDQGSGLWSGAMKFNATGLYDLSVEAVDGAGNRTNRQLYTVTVASPLRVKNSSNEAPESAAATLFVRSDELNRWEIWDGRAYGQQNPQSVTGGGELGYLIPKGTYYLEILAPGYKKKTSDVFTVESTQSLNQQIILNKLSGLKIFGRELTWPQLRPDTFEVDTRLVDGETARATYTVLGNAFPAFDLTTTRDEKLSALNLRGKYTVVSVMATWSPGTAELLPYIEELQKNKDFRFMPLFVQERKEKVASYMKSGGYDVSALVDPEGQLVEKLQVSDVPTHYIVDRRGTVKRVIKGTLNKDKLLKALVGL